jgi:AcrR family transcriptional regulator
MPTDTTPERIEGAALRLFLSQGVKKTDLEEVGFHAGVTRITVYRHYGNRRGLVHAVCLRISRIYQTAADDGAGETMRELNTRLEQLGHALSELPPGNLLALLEEVHRLYPDVYEEFCTLRRAAVDRIFRHALAAATREGTLREGLNREVLKAIFWAAVVGLIENPALISSNVPLHEIFATVADLFRYGVLSQAPSAKRRG